MSSGESSDGGSSGADAREFDAIVVGTGPGGATVARELCRLGKRVLILEWGGKPVVTGSFRQALRELGMPGRSLFLTGKGIAVVRGITTGGTGGPVMGFYGAPSYEAKWNARMFVDEATAGGATLLTEAKVRRVLVEDGTATGVEFTRKGKTERAFAPHVVVAAGGIGSPLILRASGLERAGYDFFYDPLICALGSVGDLKGEQEPPMQAGLLMEDEGYVLTDMSVPAPLYVGMSAQVGRLDRLFAHGRTLQIMIKVRDDLSGRLTRRGGIRKPLTREDRDRLDSGYRRAREILANAGAKHIFRSWCMAAHPGGTVKVGDLLDAELQTEYENLYVCDASVIPEPWGRPPTLTLIGLGKRLARHLAVPLLPDTASDQRHKRVSS